MNQLRLYQEEVVNKILSIKEPKCLVKMFCGTGKSDVIINLLILCDYFNNKFFPQRNKNFIRKHLL